MLLQRPNKETEKILIQPHYSFVAFVSQSAGGKEVVKKIDTVVYYKTYIEWKRKISSSFNPL